MKKTFLVFGLLAIALCTTAQKNSVGKTIAVNVVNEFTTAFSAAGQDMEMGTKFIVDINVEIKSLVDKTVTLNTTLKKISTSTNINGYERSFNSDDAEAKSDPQFAEAFKDLNKPIESKVEIGKVYTVKDLNDIQNAKNIVPYLFLPVDANVKEGYTWADSVTIIDGSKTVNNYIVDKIAGDIITVKVASNSIIKSTSQQNGMDVKMNMELTNTDIREYNITSGILQISTNNYSTKGTAETQGMSIPMSMTGKIITTTKL
ncbi:MAG: hypothetical protein JSR12_10550 [Bacteroidetes bacterium]|nr:hypothetical protein [Bacteroidota bacterium]